MRSDDRELLRRVVERAAPGPGEGAAPADAEVDRLAALWAALDPPAAEPAPPGFAGRVMARVREEHAGRDRLARRFGRLPARWAAASALSAGLVAGGAAGVLLAPAEVAGPEVAAGAALAGDEAVAGAADEDADALVSAAVAAAAGGEEPAEPAESADPLFTVEPELAGDYLAALAALEAAS